VGPSAGVRQHPHTGRRRRGVQSGRRRRRQHRNGPSLPAPLLAGAGIGLLGGLIGLILGALRAIGAMLVVAGGAMLIQAAL
jgi:hypothetical protein